MSRIVHAKAEALFIVDKRHKTVFSLDGKNSVEFLNTINVYEPFKFVYERPER